MIGRRTTLVECRARFVRWDGREPGSEFGPADAVFFECPEFGGLESRCTHTVPMTQALDGSVSDRALEKRLTWSRVGEDVADLTLAPSIRCSGYCRWHGYVKDGGFTFCDDSKGHE